MIALVRVGLVCCVAATLVLTILGYTGAGFMVAGSVGVFLGAFDVGYRSLDKPADPVSPLTEQLKQRDHDAYIDRLERECRIGPYADGVLPERPRSGARMYPEQAPYL